MADDNIYISEVISTRTRRRCYKIEIDNPNGGVRKFGYHQQDVTEDLSGNEVSSKSAKSLMFNVMDIVTDVIPITDPVTGLTTNISAAAVALWLEAHYVLKAKADIAAATTAIVNPENTTLSGTDTATDPEQPVPETTETTETTTTETTETTETTPTTETTETTTDTSGNTTEETPA